MPHESQRSRRSRLEKILDVLEQAHPEATCALHWRTPFELLVATILSAQCTDERVNQVTPALFARFPTPSDMAEASLAELEDLIRSTGFFRAKARNLRGCAETLVARFGGQVPRTMAELVTVPGSGRKTANVVLGHAHGVAEGIAVDTHVLRVSGRLGVAKGADAPGVEKELMALLPPERWTRASDLLIFHGRKVCAALRPRCGACPAFALCAWPERGAWALGAGGTLAKKPTRRGGRR